MDAGKPLAGAPEGSRGAGGAPKDGQPAAQTAEGQQPATREQRYRQERNAEREKVTALTTEVQALRTERVESLVADKLAQPADFLTFVKLDDVLNEQGRVDPQLVEDALADLLESRPGLGKARVTHPNFGQGTGFGRQAADDVTWGTVIRGEVAPQQ